MATTAERDFGLALGERVSQGVPIWSLIGWLDPAGQIYRKGSAERER